MKEMMRFPLIFIQSPTLLLCSPLLLLLYFPAATVHIILHLPIMSPSETRTLSQQTTRPDVAQWILLCCPSKGCSRCLPVEKFSNSAGADGLCPVALTSTVIKCSGKTCFDATSYWISIYFGPKPISLLKIRCWLWLLISMCTLSMPRGWPRRFVDFSSALKQSNLN